MQKHILKQLFYLKMVQEGKIFFWSVFVTAVISRRLNKTTTLMIFFRINFFNTCAAPAFFCVIRFGCGFLLQLRFFKEHILMEAAQCSRHKQSGDSMTNLKNIWWFTEIFSERSSSIFLRPMSELLLPTGWYTFFTEHSTYKPRNLLFK